MCENGLIVHFDEYVRFANRDYANALDSTRAPRTVDLIAEGAENAEELDVAAAFRERLAGLAIA